ncbi:hypothetical protein HYQ09_gp100 [Acinetobacter phage vB_AbaM_Konradin]|uniref:Uncharacterized protein n=8 Tax=Lazarusvirus TaxID=2842820 RepID=A0A4Y1NL53_9CAUD|nr:hypothetical protein HYP67_gp103 [Acinetobacter phage vB_ApiM_fHyAci03]YP_009881600.1 hypothetical protein HYP70_gp180 [Acinetobacter phage KARL-1]YP_009885284.1 hypothetical protein HYQ09_gp100 [Acinetobacter phage vB_AbaM_Konradin]YP_009886130.1 hypothetical protein HYQ20_gp103 [Acinetobacter phage vB_AbaM_Berthold]YP_009886375.1 hypothetical protein HYQ21_gp098 [Acinetobacter phage vB_AbaM_Apostate]YP_009886874.1 hypothetical protein HYQ23_gp101 [Acinetobacter phage vB_AbaM_Lazarus]YP_0
MNLKQYLNHLNRLVKNDPELLNCKIVSASDDEGNVVKEVHFRPSVCKWDPIEEAFDECGQRVICVN